MRDIDIIKRIKKVEHKKGFVNKTTGGYVLNTGKFQYFNDLRFGDIQNKAIGLTKSIEGNYNNTVIWGTGKGISAGSLETSFNQVNVNRNNFSAFSTITQIVTLKVYYGCDIYTKEISLCVNDNKPYSYYVAPSFYYISNIEIIETNNPDLDVIALNKNLSKIALINFDINDTYFHAMLYCNYIDCNQIYPTICSNGRTGYMVAWRAFAVSYRSLGLKITIDGITKEKMLYLLKFYDFEGIIEEECIERTWYWPECGINSWVGCKRCIEYNPYYNGIPCNWHWTCNFNNLSPVLNKIVLTKYKNRYNYTLDWMDACEVQGNSDFFFDLINNNLNNPAIARDWAARVLIAIPRDNRTFTMPGGSISCLENEYYIKVRVTLKSF